MEIPAANVLFLLSHAAGYQLPPEYRDYSEQPDGHQFDFIAGLLAHSAQRLVFESRKDRYVEKCTQGSKIKGKIDFSNPALIDRAPHQMPFRYRVLSLPESEYKFISLAVRQLLGEPSVSDRRKNSLRTVALFLPPPDPNSLTLRPSFVSKDHFDRDLVWCLTLAAVVNRRINLDFQHGHIPFIDLLLGPLQRGELFKRFVHGYTSKTIGSAFTVVSEKQLSWAASGSEELLTLVPRQNVDVFLNNEKASWVFEVKSGESIVENQWGAKKFRSDHLQQVFTYLYLADKLGSGGPEVRGALIFNSQTDLKPDVLELEGYKVAICPVNLFGATEGITERIDWLLSLVNQTMSEENSA